MPVQVVCHEVYVLLSCFLVRGKGTVTKQGRVSEVVLSRNDEIIQLQSTEQKCKFYVKQLFYVKFM